MVDDIQFEENITHTYSYVVLGWMDSQPIYQSFPNYKSAFQFFRVTVDEDKRKSKWFLDIIMITWGPVQKDTRGGHLLKAIVVDISYLYNEGTYEYFYMKADKEADRKIEAIFNGEERDA